MGYALTCKMQLPAVSDAITEARYQARKNGRSSIAAIDIRNALLDYQIPSHEALQQAFGPAGKAPDVKRWQPGQVRLSGESAIRLQRHCNLGA